jgi:hypothetical protein
MNLKFHNCHEDTYVGLLAVVWDSLERIGERLESARECEPASRLDDVRIELILWKDASRHFARRSDLPESYRIRLQWLLTRAEEILDAGLHESADRLAACIGEAQNCLFDEADALMGRSNAAPSRDAIAVNLPSGVVLPYVAC